MGNLQSEIPIMRGDEVVELLDNQYPKVKTALSHSTPFELLIATILSAQSTDVQTNKVTPRLFERFPDPFSMSCAHLRELERIIMPIGFYHLKSRRIRDVSRKLVEEFGGNVPQSMNELTGLPGVGRKTANVVLGAAFGKVEGIAVDTHVFRVSRRIGIAKGKTPEQVEQELMRTTKKEHWPRLSILLILHGRRVCHARKPECEHCMVSPRCLYFNRLAKKENDESSELIFEK